MTYEIISAAASHGTIAAVLSSIAGLAGVVSILIATRISIRETRRNPRGDVQLRYEDEKGDEHLIVVRDDEGRDTIEKFIYSISEAQEKLRQVRDDSSKVDRSGPGGAGLKSNGHRRGTKDRLW
jgi:hypothetical protein